MYRGEAVGGFCSANWLWYNTFVNDLTVYLFVAHTLYTLAVHLSKLKR